MSLFDADWELLAERLMPPVTRDADFREIGGDFRAGDPENQYIHYLVVSAPGHWKEFPSIGAAVIQYIQSSAPSSTIQRAIRVQLINDVFSNPLVDASKFPTIVINSVVIKL